MVKDILNEETPTNANAKNFEAIKLPSTFWKLKPNKSNIGQNGAFIAYSKRMKDYSNQNMQTHLPTLNEIGYRGSGMGSTRTSNDYKTQRNDSKFGTGKSNLQNHGQYGLKGPGYFDQHVRSKRRDRDLGRGSVRPGDALNCDDVMQMMHQRRKYRRPFRVLRLSD